MSNDTNDNVSQVIADQYADEFKTQIDIYHNSLVTNNKNSILPESLFKARFLPYFIGEVDPHDAKQMHETITDWVSVAGSPTAEVDITDDATGQVVLTIPGIFNTGGVDVFNRNKITSLSSILKDYQLKANHIPMVAEIDLQRNLTHSASEILSPEVQEDPRWEVMLNRYGKGTVKTESTKDSMFDTDDGLILDE